MDRRLLPLGIVVEWSASILMVLSTPSDVHPSIRAFLVEHSIAWVFTLAALVPFTNATLAKNLSGPLQTALACLIAELVSTCLMWMVIPSDLSHLDQVSQEWFGGFWDYFLRRLLLWRILAAIALVVKEQIKGLAYEAWQGKVETNAVWLEVVHAGGSPAVRK